MSENRASEGTFATHPSLPSPMTLADAIEAARRPGFRMEGPDAGTAKATASIVTYREYQRRSGFTHGVQLGSTDEVIVVVVRAPVVVHAPSPGAARTYGGYEVGFDRRTGLMLGRTCRADLRSE